MILGIETSCDETSAAIVEAPLRVLSNVVSSQIDLHGPYGGVVPEIACRSHVRVLPQVIDEALRQAGVSYEHLDAVAVTVGPGLAGSLLVGLSAAKALALRLDLPMIAVNHLHGHLFSAFLDNDTPHPSRCLPFVGLIVSGGHTCLVHVDTLMHFRLLGQTIDDAAGEAFDKGANLLGLGYPGGPILDQMAANGNPAAIRFPRGRVTSKSGCGDLNPHLCFSYSGLKTSLRTYLQSHGVPDPDESVCADVVASYQEAIVQSIMARVELAMKDKDLLVVGGGVALNSRLRQLIRTRPDLKGKKVLLTPPKYCGDNAAMVAAVAGLGIGHRLENPFECDIQPNLAVAFAV